MSSSYEFHFSKNNTFHLRSCSKCLPLARTHALSLGRHSSIALSTTVCFMSAQTEMRRCFRSSISRIGVWYTRSCCFSSYLSCRSMGVWRIFLAEYKIVHCINVLGCTHCARPSTAWLPIHTVPVDRILRRRTSRPFLFQTFCGNSFNSRRLL